MSQQNERPQRMKMNCPRDRRSGRRGAPRPRPARGPRASPSGRPDSDVTCRARRAMRVLLALLLAVTPPAGSVSHDTFGVTDARDMAAVVRLQLPSVLTLGSTGTAEAGMRTDLLAPGDGLRRRWTWAHIGEALSAKKLGGPLTVQRTRSGLFPFQSGGALTGLLPSDSPFGSRGRESEAYSVDGATLPQLLRHGKDEQQQQQEEQHETAGGGQPYRYYFSGKILELSAGAPVAGLTQPLGYELLDDTALVRPLAEATAALRRSRLADAPPYDANPTTSSSSSGGAELQANLWLSSANASTPLHYDTSANLFVQLRGRKRFWLLPPAAATELPMEPAHSPGHRQLAVHPLDTVNLAGSDGTSNDTTMTHAERALLKALPDKLRKQAVQVELGANTQTQQPPLIYTGY
jgi:hypothetical protein